MGQLLDDHGQRPTNGFRRIGIVRTLRTSVFLKVRPLTHQASPLGDCSQRVREYFVPIVFGIDLRRHVLMDEFGDVADA